MNDVNHSYAPDNSSCDNSSIKGEIHSADKKNEFINLQMNASVAGVMGDGAATQKKSGANTVIRCDVCCCEMSSDLVYNSHVNGSRHRKRVKALEIVASLKGEKGIEVGPEDNPNAYRCEVCLMTLNSPQQLEIHLAGSKHKNKVAKEKLQNVVDNGNNENTEGEEICNTDSPPSKKRKKDGKYLSCDICNITVNSETQYEQHIVSKKHVSREKGENCPKRKVNKSDNRSNFFQNFVPGNRFHGGKELDKSPHDGPKPPPPFPPNNMNRLLPGNPPPNPRSNFNQMNNDGVNKGHFNNFNFPPRPFINNQRNYGGNFGGVPDVGKFFPKIRHHMFNSRDPIMQAHSK
ncbi:UNVERIFIED_CONTAM: hypothetical protein PYX00_002859 [Menopon gallinae]|uniref:C2H2-type domain-containing protein n=1 Tax=Menopon gallinae TaxID=328185 RepID=A0AAW2HY23_9NEOP